MQSSAPRILDSIRHLARCVHTYSRHAIPRCGPPDYKFFTRQLRKSVCRVPDGLYAPSIFSSPLTVFCLLALPRLFPLFCVYLIFLQGRALVFSTSAHGVHAIGNWGTGPFQDTEYHRPSPAQSGIGLCVGPGKYQETAHVVLLHCILDYILPLVLGSRQSTTWPESSF